MKHKLFSAMASFLACFVLIAAFAGCSESDDLGGGGGSKGKSIKLQKLDLSGAKYLTLVDNSRAEDSDEVGLFKIDENGNMTTVVLSCTEEEDGNVTKIRTDIKVKPFEIHSLAGIYTFMYGCEFIDGNGNRFGLKQYYEPESTEIDFNILVRHSDGAIFYIPDELSNGYFNRPNIPDMVRTAFADDKGNLYLFGRGLGKLTTQNGQLVMKQVNSSGVYFSGTDILPFDNETVMVQSPSWENGYNNFTILYPNGGFENYNGEVDNLVSITKVKSGAKAVVLNEVQRENTKTEYIVSLHDFRVGTSYGDHTLSGPLASYSSGTDYTTDYTDPDYRWWIPSASGSAPSHLKGVYESNNWYFIGQYFVIDKRTMEMRELETPVIFPDKTNVYKGLSWVVYNYDGQWIAKWSDIESLQYGKININLPANFSENSSIIDIPSGKLILTGVRYVDGKTVTYFIDFETGNYTCTETDSERPITALIPLN